MGNASNIIFTFFVSTILLLILSAGPINARELSISPLELSLRGFVSEKICGNITLGNNSKIIFQNRWALENSKDLTQYTQTAEYFKIKIERLAERYYSDKTFFDICFVAEKPGTYYGALMFKAEGSNLGVGTWIKLNVKSSKSLLSKITGFVSNETRQIKFNKNIILMVGSTLILLVALLVLLKIKKSNSKNDSFLKV